MKNTALVLWVGREVYIEAQDGLAHTVLPERGDHVEAVCKLIADLPGSPKSIRLVYQPGDLDSSPVEVPKAGRNVIQRVLARDHVNLGTDNCCWGCLTLFAAGKTYSSVLLVESSPRLQRLKHALLEEKIEIVGAWPLPTLIETFPPFNSPKANGLAIVRTEAGAILYGVDRSGTRAIAAFQDEQFRASLLNALNQNLALYDPTATPTIYLFSPEKDEQLEELLAPYAPVMPGMTSLIENIPSLNLKHPSNFLPTEFTINVNAIFATVGSTSFLLAIVLAVLYVMDIRHVTEDQFRKRSEADRISSRIATFEKNRDAIDAAKSFTQEAMPANARTSELLRFFSKNIPQTVTIRSFKVNELTFTIEGLAHDPAKNGADYTKFVTALSSQPGYRIAESARPGATPEFIITGTFVK